MRLNIIARISVLEICVDSGYTFECISILTKVQVFSYRDVSLNNHRTVSWCLALKKWGKCSPTKSEAAVWWFFIDSNVDFFHLVTCSYFFFSLTKFTLRSCLFQDKRFSKIFLRKWFRSLFLSYINCKNQSFFSVLILYLSFLFFNFLCLS